MLLAACAADEAPRIRTATSHVVVDDTVAAVDSVTRAAERAGGHVTETRIWREGEELRASVTIHVPREKLTSTLATVHGVATRLESETIASRGIHDGCKLPNS